MRKLHISMTKMQETIQENIIEGYNLFIRRLMRRENVIIRLSVVVDSVNIDYFIMYINNII